MIEQGYTPPSGGFRTFVIMWATQALSVFGSQLTFFAMTVWLAVGLYPNTEQQPQLAAALSMVSLAFALPNLLLAPFAGVLADRVDRKAIMFWTNVALAVMSLALLLVLAAQALELWSLLVFMTCSASLQCLHSSAFDSSYAMLVPEHHLPRANGMMQTIFSLAGILTPAFAAALIALPALMRKAVDPSALTRFIAGIPEGAVLVVAVNVVTFIIAAVVLPFLHIPSPKQAQTHKSRNMLSDVKEGMAFIGKRRGLLWLLLLFAVFNFCAAPAQVLRPVIVRDNLGLDVAARGLSYEAALAMIGSIGAIGGAVGGVLVTLWGGLKQRKVLGVLVPLVIGAIAQVVVGFSHTFFVAAAAFAVGAFVIPLANAHSQTIWQTQTPRAMQGRVFSVRRVVAQFTAPIGTAMAGYLGGLNPGFAVAVCGLVAAIYALAQFLNRTMLSLEDQGIFVTSPASTGASESKTV